MRTPVQRWGELLATHTRAIIVVLVFATVVVGAGAPMVEEDSNIDQFESDSPAANASAFIDANFVAEGAANQTTVQVIRRGADGADVLTREDLVATIQLQQEMQEHPDIGPSLAEDEPMTGIPNVVALYQLRETLGGLETGEGLDTEAVAGFNGTERAALARLLGFEGAEVETVGQVVAAAGEFGDQFDLAGLAALNETAREQRAGTLSDALGFDETETATVVELFDVLAADEPPVELAALDGLTRTERTVVTSLLGVETAPPESCLAAFGELATRAGQTTDQGQPPLVCQRWLVEEMDEGEFEAAIEGVLGPDGQSDALALMPQSYEPGSTTATAYSVFVTQRTQGGSIADGFSDSLAESQRALRGLSGEHDRSYTVFGLALLDAEIDRSLGDSSALVGPIAVVFVILVLAVAYRDLFDILLGIGGVFAVLLWTFGFMGWTGIAFNQLMISVPVLLIGLSIDYAIHVFMRHRERRDAETGVGRAMTVALAGVGVALVWVTATAAIGFLSNLISPIGPLREFGLASAFGIAAALLVFGALVPAVKIELDRVLESRGRDRRMAAFGTGDSRLSAALEVGAVAARRAPLAVLAVALVVSGLGAYGASQVDTSFQEEDFIADDPPEWTAQLPGPMAPGEYEVTRDLEFVQENFQQVGRNGELLIRGDVTDDRVLRWLDSAAANASEQETTFVLPNDRPDVRSPLTEMRATARRAPESAFAASFRGFEGVPDENVSALYDQMAEANPAASEVVYAADGAYEALRVQVGIDGTAGQAAATADLRTIATHLEEQSGGRLDVVATGDPVTGTEVENDLFRTVIESLLVTLVAVFLFLAVAYRLTGNPASLGVVTLLPVLFSVTWILGTMWLVGMPFNALTGTIAALTVGLGIAYSIHISARYELELRRQGDVWAALDTTVTGTGGALLGSAATTVGGFGTLAFAILPALRQFGIITALTIVYAFLASVLLLPSLLVLWTRYLGPSGQFPGETSEDSPGGDAPAATDD